MSSALRPLRGNRASRRARQYRRACTAPLGRDHSATVLQRHYAIAAGQVDQQGSELAAQAELAHQQLPNGGSWQAEHLHSWAELDRAAAAALQLWQALLARSWRVEQVARQRAARQAVNDRAPAQEMTVHQVAEQVEQAGLQAEQVERSELRRTDAPLTPLRSELRPLGLRSHAPCRAVRHPYGKAARP